MKIQNTVTIEQAKSLNKAIREAGLKWPGIEWEHGIYKWTQNLEGNQPQLVLRVCDVEAINEDQPPAFKYIALNIPAPNLAELLAMLPPIFDCNIGEVTVENCANRLTESIKMTPKTITAHWDKIENP